MKLMMIIAGDEYVEEITTNLVENDFFATNIGSSGDFLQYGNTVLMLGIVDERIEEATKLLRGSEDRNKNHSIYHGKVEIYVIDIENHIKTHKFNE